MAWSQCNDENRADEPNKSGSVTLKQDENDLPSNVRVPTIINNILNIDMLQPQKRVNAFILLQWMHCRWPPLWAISCVSVGTYSTVIPTLGGDEILCSYEDN